MAKSYLFRASDLNDYMIRFFVKLGVPEADARISAEVLLSADLRGVDSHGIIRLNTYYGDRLRKGLIDPLSPVKVLQENLCTLALDGGNGLGQVVAHQAMTRCIEKARTTGLAAATVRNSNHYGIAGYYAMMALPHDMIGISFTNSQPLVAPTYGRTAILGTNPIAVAAPALNNRPYVLDMATSIVPIGRVTVYQKNNKPIPPGWGIDSEGRVTEDPTSVIEGGALMPLGGIDLMRGYKGYGLALLVDIFSGVLAGSGFAENVGNANEGSTARVGHFFAAIRIDTFRDPQEFKQDMDALLDDLRNSPKAADEERIFIHGEKEFEKAERAQSDGVPISAATYKILKTAGEEDGVPFELTPVKVE